MGEMWGGMRSIKPDFRKSLLILESKNNSLPLMRTFLQNREFLVHSTTSFKEAMAYLVKYKPKFFMVSVDYPNRGVVQLSRQLTETMGVCVILYAEKNVASSIQLLVDSKWDYLLYPPVTGPSVERVVNRIFRDSNKRLAEQRFAEAELLRRQRHQSKIAEGAKFFKGTGGNFSIVPLANDATQKIPVLQDAESTGLPEAVKGDHNNVIPFPTPTAAPTSAAALQDFVCTMVEWNGQFGYLLVRPHARQIKPPEVSAISARIKEVYGPTVRTESFRVRLKPEVFYAWVKIMSDSSGMLFEGKVLKSVFVPCRSRKPLLQPCEHEGMMQIAISEVPTNENLDFNIYLHLRLNNKFVLYVRRGLDLSLERLQQLMEKGVHHLHILKLEADDFNSHHAQRYLNTSLQETQYAAAA
jgi:hypothetical protein